MKNSKIKSVLNLVLSAPMKAIAGISLLFFPANVVNGEKSYLIHDNLKRTFIIHGPSVKKTQGKLPLIIALHGRGGNSESMILVTRGGFNKLADTDKFIAVYPDGIEENWNDGRMDEEADDRAHRENIDDVGFISDLIDLMIKNYNVDPKKVYLTGISNGAIMSYRLACELSDKIAAIAPVDGSIPDMIINGCNPAKPVSVLAINNVNDPLVPYEGGEIWGHFHSVNLGKVLSAGESVSFWIKRNQCHPREIDVQEPDLDPKDGTIVKHSEYFNDSDGSEVILYSVFGGGHTWPGGMQYLPEWVIGKTSRDIDANEIIWAFFKRHTRT